MEPLKSVDEAAGLLGISPWTIRGYIRDGKIKPVRLGRRVLVEEAELERFVALCQDPDKTNKSKEASL
jgi:excisionase family DNA binding protein